MPQRRPVLDRLPQDDPRNNDYPVRPLMAARGLPLTPRSYTWRLVGTPGARPLNQNHGCQHCGQFGGCVGHAWVHEAACRPVVRPVTQVDAWRRYHRAQMFDPWKAAPLPGPLYGEAHEGTSVLAGAKAQREVGHLAEYRWATSTTEALAVASRYGPVVLGVPWLTGMWEPDDNGFIDVSGPEEGMHSLLLVGANVTGRYGVLLQSWGDWGPLRGYARVSFDGLERLLSNGGEVCVPVRR